MSFILDAITRSEQERQRQQVPTVTSIHLPPAGRPTGGWNPRLAVPLAGLIAFMLALTWWSLRPSPLDESLVVYGTAPRNGRAAEVRPAVPAPAPARDAAIEPAPASPPDSPAPASTVPTRSTPEVVVVAAGADTRKATTLASLESRIVIIEAPEPRSPEGDKPVPGRPLLDQADVASGWTLITPDALDKRVAAATEETPREAPGATSDGIYTLSGLPHAVRTRIPRVEFSGHLYSSDPAARMIIVDGGRAATEGQQVADGLYLEEITPSGVILAFDGYRFSAGIVGTWQLQ